MTDEDPNIVPPPVITVESRVGSRRKEAESISTRLGITLCEGGVVGPGEHRLVLLEDRIEIWDAQSRRRGVRVDFSNIDVRTGSGNLSRQQPLARAIGGRLDRRLGNTQEVIDATAGFGHDAFLLACMGNEVLAIERDPIIHLLLDESRTRAIQDPTLGPVVGDRLRVLHGDSTELLPSMDSVDVIYLDPMFASSTRSSALPKKRAQILRSLVPATGGVVELFEAARARARKRVVVKRAAGDAPLVPTPDLQVTGKMIRYDIYLPAGSSSRSLE